MLLRSRNINTWAVLAMVVVIALIMLRYAADISVIGSIWNVAFVSALAVTAFLLLLSLSRRIRALLSRKERVSLPRREYARIDTSASIGQVTQILRRMFGRKIAIYSENEATVLARTRGRSGAWGSVVFHAGLLIILIGLYLSHMGSVNNTLLLTEGEWCSLSATESSSTNTAALLYVSTADASPVRIQLQRLEYDHPVGGAAAPASHIISEIAGERRTAIARVNQSVNVGDWTVHHGGTWGYAPELVILGPADTVLFRGSIRVSATPTAKGAFRDSVRVDGITRALQVRVYPDFVRTDAEDSSRSKWPRNPVLFITMHDDDGARTEIPLALGQYGEAGGLRFVFPRLYRWGQLDAVRDPGLTFLLYGCVVSVLGLFLRIARTEKTIGARITEDTPGVRISLVGRTEKYPFSFQHEIKLLEHRITVELQAEEIHRGSMTLHGQDL